METLLLVPEVIRGVLHVEIFTPDCQLLRHLVPKAPIPCCLAGSLVALVQPLKVLLPPHASTMTPGRNLVMYRIKHPKL